MDEKDPPKNHSQNSTVANSAKEPKNLCGACKVIYWKHSQRRTVKHSEEADKTITFNNKMTRLGFRIIFPCLKGQKFTEA